MYKFEKRDEGLLVIHEPSQRSVAHVETRLLGETSDPNFKVQQKTEALVPREKWKVHFTGYRFGLVDLEAFLKELSAQEG